MEKEDRATPAQAPAQTPPSPAAPSAIPWDIPPPEMRARSEMESRKAVSTPKKEAIELYDKLTTLYEKNTELHESLAQEREAADRYPIESLKTDSQIEIARIRAEDREIADTKANAEAEVARENTMRAEDLNGLISSALTRFGAVVMVIWLVRIFVRKRQRSVQLSAFYLAIADAIAMSDGDSVKFKGFLPDLYPPGASETDDFKMPIESIVRMLIGLAKQSGN